MVASHETVSQVIKIMLKYIDKKTLIKMARDLHNHVRGNRSVVDTFRRIVEQLVEESEND